KYLLYAASLSFRIQVSHDPLGKARVQDCQGCPEFFSHGMAECVLICVKADGHSVILAHVPEFFLCVIRSISRNDHQSSSPCLYFPLCTELSTRRLSSLCRKSDHGQGLILTQAHSSPFPASHRHPPGWPA